ncbi:hypothetical protein BHE74_00023462 [Ensete ventricosum]|nr:hypothetical protein BHE74_00023462 [Ensete ventricosum]
MGDYVGAASAAKGGRSVVNRGEGLTAIDFGGHVSLAEKEGAGMARKGEDAGDAKRKGKKLSLDSGGLPPTEERQQESALAMVAAGDVLADVVAEEGRGMAIGVKDMRATTAARCGDQMQEWQLMATAKVEHFSWPRWLGSRGGRCWEGTQQIAGAGCYISEGKEQLVVLIKAGSGRRLSPRDCYNTAHPSMEAV